MRGAWISYFWLPPPNLNPGCKKSLIAYVNMFEQNTKHTKNKYKKKEYLETVTQKTNKTK